MNNLQYIVKNDTRAAMHMAVELCEHGDFDSVTEAFGWLMQERDKKSSGCAMETLLRYDGSDPHYRCMVCGHENYEDKMPAFCPRCGKAVKR